MRGPAIYVFGPCGMYSNCLFGKTINCAKILLGFGLSVEKLVVTKTNYLKHYR